MIPPDDERREHVEHGVRSRVNACRQRVRRMRAASQKPADGLSGFKPRIEDEQLRSAAEKGSVVESAGILPDAKAIERRA